MTEPVGPTGTERIPGPINLNRYALEFAWQGIPTFMKLPVCLKPEDLRSGAVAWMQEQGMHSHFMAEVQRHGFDTVLERAINEALSGGADRLYISVDVDAVDPAHAPGTGSPEPGGLTSAEVLRAVRRMCAEVGMVAMDVVEVSPPYDSGNNITALFAHRCVLEALTGTAMRRLGITGPDYLDEESAGGPLSPAGPV
jgi:arginase family enzyme